MLFLCAIVEQFFVLCKSIASPCGICAPVTSTGKQEALRSVIGASVIWIKSKWGHESATRTRSAPLITRISGSDKPRLQHGSARGLNQVRGQVQTRMNHESDQAGISNQHDPELRRVLGFLIRVEGLLCGV